MIKSKHFKFLLKIYQYMCISKYIDFYWPFSNYILLIFI